MSRPSAVSRRLLASSFVAVVSVGMLWVSGSANPARGSSAAICGGLASAQPPRVVKHVIWIFMENKSEGTITRSPSAPFIRSLVAACGLASDYHNITHPSLPNYLAATSGSTHGVTSDCRPAKCSQPGPSVFSQLQAAHLSWRSYVESMPSNCSTANAGAYAAKHNPAVYYRALAAGCRKWDVPLEGANVGLQHDLSAGHLPALALILPNNCDDMHSCPVSVGDAWLHTWVNQIIATPAYRAGQVIVFLTWDEGSVRGDIRGENCAANPADESCHVAMLILSAYTTPGTTNNTHTTHYSLLLTTEQLLGLPGRLGAAAAPQTHSLRPGFHL